MAGQGMVPHIEIRRNDYDSNVLVLQVTQNGLPFDFTGMNPIFECLTPDGHYIRDDGTQFGAINVVDAAQGKLEYTLVNEVFAVLGQVDVAYFAFEQQNADLQNPTNRVSTGNFTFNVIADALTGTTAASDYMSDVTTLIQQINQLKADYTTLNPANYVTQVQFTNQNNSVATQLADETTQRMNADLSLQNNKADQMYVDQVLSVISNGGPDEIFYSITALNTAYPSGDNRAKLVFDSSFTDGAHSMIWNGTIWDDAGLYQGNGIGDKTVTPPKTTFMVYGKNIINPVGTVIGQMISYNNGQLLANTDHIATDWLPILPNVTYVTNTRMNLAFYDNVEQFISSGAILHTLSIGETFTTPSNCSFIRVSFAGYSSNPNVLNTAQVEIGSSPSAYESFKPYVVDKSFLNNINNDQLNPHIVSPDNCTFFYIKNLFDKSKATDGYLVNGPTGAVQAEAAHSISDWIPVNSNLDYIMSINCNYAFFDVNKNYLSGANSVGAGTALLSPSNAAYIRFSFTLDTNNLKDKCQFEQNDVITSYTPYGLIVSPEYLQNVNLSNWYIGKKLTTFGDSITKQAKWQQYLLDNLGFMSYTNCGVEGTKVSDDGSNTGFCTDARINTIPTNSDVVMIMGATNDEGGNVPIGDLTYPYDTTKFMGALATTIKKVEALCPNALIVVMSLVGGRGTTAGVNQDTPQINGIGLWSKDYAEATKAVCEYLGKPYIPLFETSGINFYNRAAYIADTVHPNDDGGKKIGNVAVNGLKRLEPIM